MPRAAILLALLLIIHGPARSQSAQWRLGVQPAAPGSGRPAPAADHPGPPYTRNPFVPGLTGGSLTADNITSPDAGGGPLPGPLLNLSDLRVTRFQDPGADTSAGGTRGKKSPWTAVGLSAVLPGAGQVYTENYWKVPIIWGLGGYWVYEWTRNNDRYREFRDLYTRSIGDYPPNGDERYLRLREYYKDQRDSFTWYLGILYLLNVADAYVGAELYDFDVGPDLGAAGGGVHASLTVRLPVGR